MADEQMEIWNGRSGRIWVESQALLDGLFTPFEALLVNAASSAHARRVLDIGCGTGATSLAIARSLGANGTCTGIDVSEPMLALARQRAEREGLPIRFIRADAQTHAFEPGVFDMLVSRFGVMFFDDPVQAFANLRRAAAAGAALRMIAWRSAAENPFMTTAERAAAPLLPNLPPRRPDGPGQFAFGNRSHVEAILARSGWQAIDVAPIDVPCSLHAGDLPAYVTRLGPVGQLLPELDERTRAEVVRTVTAAFDQYVQDGHVRFTAACWMLSAHNA
jgi:SAM-dependent methyltransferase